MELLAKNNKNDRSETIYKIEMLNTQIKEKDIQIQALLNSKSWRITYPLRAIAHRIRHTFFLIKIIASFMKKTLKDYKKSYLYLNKSIKIIKNEGIRVLFLKAMRKIKKENESIFLGGDRYQEWILRNDTLSEKDRNEIQTRIRSLSLKPTFSIIMPVYNTDEKFLIEAIASVQYQLYPHWELCIANDASTYPYIKNILDQTCASDDRIKVSHRPINGHISLASNSAIELANGEFLIFMDHDDLLSEIALYMVAEEINSYPEASLIYSDEDKIDENGRRYDPHFKPDWNFDFFMSYGYLCHLIAIKKSIVKEIGGFRSGVEGAQDYDLLLRSLHMIDDQQKIRHIPHILYHWRAYPGSTALRTDEKPYAHLAGLNALKDYWKIKNPSVQVQDGIFNCTYRLQFPITSPLPLVSILLPTAGGFNVLKRCLESIRSKTNYLNYEILVDNGNKDAKVFKYLEALEKNWVLRLIRKNRPENEQFNYSKIVNNLSEFSKGKILVLLNDDTEVISPNWLDEIVRQTLRPDIGVVGVKLLYPNKKVQHAGVILGVGGDTGGHAFRFIDDSDPGYLCRAQVSLNLSAMTGACVALRKDVFRDVGGLEEELAVTCNDVDLCLNVRQQGLRNLWLSHIKLFHNESTSRGLDDSIEKKNRFKRETEFMIKKWSEIISNDPAYNPNLSLESEGFEVALESRFQKPWMKKRVFKTSMLINKGVQIASSPIFKSINNKLNILILKLDHRGDLLSSLPALFRLREKFNDANIDLICGPWNVSLAERFHLFRNIYSLNFFQETSQGGIIRRKDEEKILLDQLEEYDIAIDMRSYPETRILLTKVKAKLLAGYRSYSEADSSLDVCLDNFDDPTKHISLKLLDLVEAIPFETFSFPKLSDVNIINNKKTIGIFPFAGSSSRQWAIENFIELIQKLSFALPLWEIKVYFPPEESKNITAFLPCSSNVSLIEKLSLDELIDSVSNCEIIIANNSFGAHLPGFLGNKIVISIFSGVVPINEWKPVIGKQKIFYSEISCSPCYLAHSSECAYDMLCLTQISVQSIFDAVILETKIDHCDNRNERLCYQIMTPND